MTSLQGYGGHGPADLPTRRTTDSLADILERVLDKGVVIAGDVVVNLLDIELLTLKLRLLVASADTAKSMGIDWWTRDPFLSGNAQSLPAENRELRERLDRLEALLSNQGQLPAGPSPADSPSDGASTGDRSGGAGERP